MKAKTIFLTIMLLVTSLGISLAQLPEKFNYQAIIRNNAGDVLASQDIDMKLSIQESLTASVVYTETHDLQTSSNGLVNLIIGEGEIQSGNLAQIDWSAGPFELKVEIDVEGAGTFVEMGTSPLLSVPYALFAKNVENKNDADADPENELQTIAVTGDSISISSGNKIGLPLPEETWKIVGNNLHYNDGNIGIGTNMPSSKLVVQGDGTKSNDLLFAVVNNAGDTVFAVFQGGVRIYVDDNPSKAIGNKGGFAVGGFNSNKGLSNEFLRVTPDSVRIYIEQESTKAVGNKGGFAVGGFNSSKGTIDQFFNISGNLETDSIVNENRILWYPNKNAFLTGRIKIEHPDSVGENSMASGFESLAKGNYSQAFGYQSKARGANATALGYQSVAQYDNSFAFGQWAQANALESYAFGRGAIAEGFRSFSFGSAGVDSAGQTTNTAYALGDYAFAIGQGSVAEGMGSYAIGLADTASGPYSFAIGTKSAAKDYYSIAIGHRAKSNTENAIAIGNYSSATGYASIALGTVAEATNGSIAIGSVTSSGGGSTAIGSMSTATGSTSTAIGYYNTASGQSATAMGEFSEASGIYATAFGYNTSSEGMSSVAMGHSTTASNDYATAMGVNTIASGHIATAMGEATTASGLVSFATGAQNIASGKLSFASGLYTVARACNSFVVGRYNDTLTSSSQTSWQEEDPLFIIGNGDENNGRSNAVMVKKDGSVYLPDVYIDEVGLTNRDLFIDDEGKLGYVTSSKRYKTGIQPMENIDWFYKLQPVNFAYKKDENGLKQYGLIAEEVEKINPLFVSYNDNGEVETVLYSKFVSVLIKAVNDQNDKILLLESENKESQQKIDELEKRLSAIEAKLTKE